MLLYTLDDANFFDFHKFDQSIQKYKKDILINDLDYRKKSKLRISRFGCLKISTNLLYLHSKPIENKKTLQQKLK